MTSNRIVEMCLAQGFYFRCSLHNIGLKRHSRNLIAHYIDQSLVQRPPKVRRPLDSYNYIECPRKMIGLRTWQMHNAQLHCQPTEYPFKRPNLVAPRPLQPLPLLETPVPEPPAKGNRKSKKAAKAKPQRLQQLTKQQAYIEQMDKPSLFIWRNERQPPQWRMTRRIADLEVAVLDHQISELDMITLMPFMGPPRPKPNEHSDADATDDLLDLLRNENYTKRVSYRHNRIQFGIRQFSFDNIQLKAAQALGPGHASNNVAGGSVVRASMDWLTQNDLLASDQLLRTLMWGQFSLYGRLPQQHGAEMPRRLAELEQVMWINM